MTNPNARNGCSAHYHGDGTVTILSCPQVQAPVPPLDNATPEQLNDLAAHGVLRVQGSTKAPPVWEMPVKAQGPVYRSCDGCTVLRDTPEKSAVSPVEFVGALGLFVVVVGVLCWRWMHRETAEASAKIREARR